MTDKEILTKAIEKAFLLDAPVNYEHCNSFCFESPSECIYSNIFSHSFAKAFWGEEPYFGTEFHSLAKSGLRDFMEGGTNRIPHWQYHLQQMVLEENPISYLEKFL